MNRLINTCWRYFKRGGLLCAVLAAVGAFYFAGRVDEELRAAVESRLRGHYRGLIVKVRSAKILHGEGIEVRGLTISDPRVSGPDAELARFDEVVLACNTELTNLAQGNLGLRQVAMRRPVLRVVRRADGTWSGDRLLPFPCLSERPLQGTIEGATVEIVDPTQAPATTLTLRDIQMAWGPAYDMPPSSCGKPMLRLRGQLAADSLRRAVIELVVDPAGGFWSVAGDFEHLELSNELAQKLPAGAGAGLASIGGLRAFAAGKFEASHQAGRAPAYDFHVAGRLDRGRIDDSRWPYPVTDLAARFECDRTGIAIDELSARAGPTAVRLAIRRDGYASTNSTRISAACANLPLDTQLLDILPESLRAHWHKLFPTGAVDVALDLNHDGAKWSANNVVANLRDVAFTYYKFPYRLERSSGEIRFANDQLDMRLVAYSRAEQIRVGGRISRLGPAWAGWVSVQGDRVPVDEKLLLALPPKCGEIVRSLHPQGTVNIDAVFNRQLGEFQPVEKRIKLLFERGSIRYDRFPYPLYELSGHVHIDNDDWEFNGWSGENDTGRVTCSGEMTTSAAGADLTLNFQGENISIEEELRRALSPSAQRLWGDLRPRGTTNVIATVHHAPDEQGTRVFARAEPVGDSVSIDPVKFPYRFDKLRGVFSFSDGSVKLERLSAEHDRTIFRANDGLCVAHPSGSWQLRLQDIAVDHAWADRDLLEALDPRLRHAVSSLKLQGPFNLSGMIDVTSPGTPGAPLVAKWNLNTDFHGNSLVAGLPVQNLHGGVWLLGGFDGERIQSHGELLVDSATIKEFQFTDIRGPLWFEDGGVLLGAPAHASAAEPKWFDERQQLQAYWTDPNVAAPPQRTITAALYGGMVTLNGAVNLGETIAYNVAATLNAGDLRRMARETNVRPQRMGGEVFATVELQGQGSGVNLLNGGGSLRLRNADMFELPGMVQMLKILSIRMPDASAFSKADVDFKIDGGHVYLNRIDFNGDAISMFGQGEMNFNREVRMVFYTLGGNDEFKIPILRELVGGASQQIMQIHVRGTLDDLVVEQQPFPMVQEALEQLQLHQSHGLPLDLPLPSGVPMTTSLDIERR